MCKKGKSVAIFGYIFLVAFALGGSLGEVVQEELDEATIMAKTSSLRKVNLHLKF